MIIKPPKVDDSARPPKSTGFFKRKDKPSLLDKIEKKIRK